VRDLDGVVEHVLAIGRAVFLTAKELDQLRVQIVDAGFERRAFALDLDRVLDLAAGLFDHVLDAGRVDTAVGDELLQRQTRHLTAHRVKGGHRNGLGRIVDDQIDARDRFERADIAALAADDASLHFVVGKRHDGYRRLRRMIGSAALDGSRDDLAGLLVGLLLHLRLDLLDLHGRLVTNLGFHVAQKVRLGILLRQAADLFEHIELALLDLGDLFLLVLDGGDTLCQILFLLLVDVQLLVERFFLLLEAAFLLLQLVSALLVFSFLFGSRFMDLFLGLKQHLALLVLTAADRFVDDALRLFFGAADLLFGDLLAIGNAKHEEQRAKHDEAGCDAKEEGYHMKFHNLRTHLLFF